jgi:N-acylneuraminate cytidylyltransferase
VFLQCTSPLTTGADIDATIERLEAAGADSALSAVPFHHFLWRADAGGEALGVNHDRARRERRQDRIPEYLEDGAVYVMKAEGFRRAKHRFFGKTVLRVAQGGRVCEIDDPGDLDVAEVLLRRRDERRAMASLPRPVRALVMDFDGVHTDDRVSVGQDGSERVVCSRSDGLGLERLRATGLPMLVLSKERNPVVKARCEKLRLDHVQGLDDKLAGLRQWLDDRGVPGSHVVYVGNDVNDLPCMAYVGCAVATADAHPDVRRAASIVLSRRGGRGALREVAELIIEVNT